MPADFGIGETATAVAASSAAETASAAALAASSAAELGGVIAATAPAITAASTIPWLAIAGIGTSLVSAGIGAMGSEKSAAATAQAAKYNAQVASENQTIAQQNATWAGQAGEEVAGASEMKTRAVVGALKANEAASGVDVNTGSAPDVRSSASALGELDAINIRANAARQAYGYETTATSEGAQSQLDTFQAENASAAGDIGAASTFLGGAGNAATNFARWLQSGGIMTT